VQEPIQQHGGIVLYVVPKLIKSATDFLKPSWLEQTAKDHNLTR